MSDHISVLYFPRIVPWKDNEAVLNDTLAIEELRKTLVARMEKIEDSFYGRWWSDRELVSLFHRLDLAGVIFLPKEVTDRMRWIALVCALAAEIEKFAFGNVIVEPDYLPDEFLEEFEKIYGLSVIDEVREFRKQAKESGWEKYIS